MLHPVGAAAGLVPGGTDISAAAPASVNMVAPQLTYADFYFDIVDYADHGALKRQSALSKA
jgi:hypothetical protein